MMFEQLKFQFEENIKTLKDVDENIRRITGRNPDEFAVTPTGNIKLRSDGPFLGKFASFPNRKRIHPNQQSKENAPSEEESVMDDDSPDEEGQTSKKPSLQSTVVAKHNELKTRRATIEEQKGDKKVMARNRRMFGMILGTLQKFQSEESRRLEQAKKRAEIDKKVEEAAEKEKEQMKKEKEQLFVTRKEKQVQIRCLEKKMEIAEIYDTWEQNHKHLLNFIQTTAKPPIMFLPMKQNSKSKKAMEESQERIMALLENKRNCFEKELLEIDEWYTKESDEVEQSEEVGEKENIGPSDQMMEDNDGKSVDITNTQPSELVEHTTEHGNEHNEVKCIETDSMPPHDEAKPPCDNVLVDGKMLTDTCQPDPQSVETTKKLVDHEDFEPIYDE